MNHLGLTLAQLGPFADPTSVETMAVAAETRGYGALWVIDRLLDPVTPRAKYPATPDGSLPEEQRIALDPLMTLATAAAHTTRIRIGTNVLVAPWYRPVLLARSLASLDGLERAGRRADGWTPSGLPLDVTALMWSVVTSAAERAGRDPSQLSLVVRANIKHTARPTQGERATYHGSIEQISGDVRDAF